MSAKNLEEILSDAEMCVKLMACGDIGSAAKASVLITRARELGRSYFEAGVAYAGELARLRTVLAEAATQIRSDSGSTIEPDSRVGRLLAKLESSAPNQ